MKARIHKVASLIGETVHACEFRQGRVFRTVEFPRRVDVDARPARRSYWYGPGTRTRKGV